MLQFVEWGLGMYCSKNLSQIHLNIEAFQSIDFLKLGCMLNSISDLSHCKNSYCEKFCQSASNWWNILSVKSRNWTCQWGRDGFGLTCSSLATIKPQQTVGSPKVNFADNRTKNYTCTHTNSEHRRSVIRADADLLDEASKSRSYGASLFSIYQLQDKSEVQIKLGMSPALKYIVLPNFDLHLVLVCGTFWHRHCFVKLLYFSFPQELITWLTIFRDADFSQFPL